MKKILVLLSVCSFGIAPVISATEAADSPADEATQAEELRKDLPTTGKKCKCQEKKGIAASEQAHTPENSKTENQ